MMRTRRPLWALGLIATLVMSAREASAQASPRDLITGARAQLDQLNADSASALLLRVLDPRLGATLAEQVRALVLIGVSELMHGRIDAAKRVFTQALTLQPDERVDSLADLQSQLVVTFNDLRSALDATRAPTPPSVLVIEGLPAGAQVSVDGALWTAPSQEVAPGVHRILANAAGYKAYADSVLVLRGTTAVKQITMSRAEPARLSVSSYPWRRAYLDSLALGETPIFERQVPAGAHTLRLLSSDGNRVFQAAIDLPSGELTRMGMIGAAPSGPRYPSILATADSLYGALRFDSAVVAYRRALATRDLQSQPVAAAHAATRAAVAWYVMGQARGDSALKDSARSYFAAANRYFRGQARSTGDYHPDSLEFGPQAISALSPTGGQSPPSLAARPGAAAASPGARTGEPVATNSQRASSVDRAGTFEMGIALGVMYLDQQSIAVVRVTDPAASQIAPAGVIAIEYHPGLHLNVGIRLAVGTTSGATFTQPSLNVGWTVNLNGSVSQFFTAGFGITDQSWSGNHLSGYGLGIGTGVRIMLSEVLAARAEAREQYEHYSQAVLIPNAAFSSSLSLGISYFVGVHRRGSTMPTPTSDRR